MSFSFLSEQCAMNIGAVMAAIERVAPPAAAAPWDKSGLQVAAERSEIFHLAVCLDPMPELLASALEKGADMVLSHHPLSLKPRFPDRPDAYLKALRLLLRADVPLYAAHTSLDANPEGPVSCLADRLSMTDRQVLEPTAELTSADGRTLRCGFGIVGDVPPLSPHELADILSAIACGGCMRIAGTLPAVLRRIAICPGSGSSLAPCAAALKADVLITGDVKYHTALEAPLPLVDIGHFALEEEMMRCFASDLDHTLEGVTVTFLPADDPLRAFLPMPHPAQEEIA